MPRHLVLRLDGPLMSFGGEAIDNFGVIRRFPAKSSIIGLLGNALGFERYDAEHLQRLQDRLVMASRIERSGELLRDFQTVHLRADDEGWTTRGRPEGRNSDSSSFKLDKTHLRRTGESIKTQTHQRFRDYWADAFATIVFRLASDKEPPTLEAIASALLHPVRPLFLGRKPCLPSRPLLAGTVDAEDVHAALAQVEAPSRDLWRGEYLQWPDNEGPQRGPAAGRLVELCDERNWVSGVHGGLRSVRVLDRGREESGP